MVVILPLFLRVLSCLLVIVPILAVLVAKLTIALRWRAHALFTGMPMLAAIIALLLLPVVARALITVLIITTPFDTLSYVAMLRPIPALRVMITVFSTTLWLVISVVILSIT